MLIKNSFGELVAEVEPFLSLQKAAKSKSKSVTLDVNRRATYHLST